MTVTLEGRTPCLLCGYRHHVVQTMTVRINKRSMVANSGLTSVGLRTCPECWTPNASEMQPVSPYRMLPADMAKVRAYRARKGWTP